MISNKRSKQTLSSVSDSPRSKGRTIRRAILICGGVVLLAVFWLFHANNLGLTGFDYLLGKRPNMDTLRTNTKVAADAFLAQRKTDLIGESKKKYELVLDYSKASKIRRLGYWSSFYYYCWDIYLPYSFRTPAGDAGIIIVQLSDSTPGNHHDPQKFQVIRAMLFDNQGKEIKQIE